MDTRPDTRGGRAERRARLQIVDRPVIIGVVAGLTAAATLAGPVSATPPPVPGAGTYTVVEVTEEDFGNDGDAELITTTRETFDRRGRVQSRVVEDRGGDGRVFVVVRTLWEYDSQGRTLLRTVETDYEGDLVLDLRQQTAFEYDRSGQLVRTVETYDSDADGTGVTTTTTGVTATKKAVISNVIEIDYDGDGTLDERTVETTHYDRRGNEVLATTTTDNGLDGTIDVERRLTRTFDKATLISERDEVILPYAASSLTTYAYDRKGQLTGITETEEPSGRSAVTTFSFDADGAFSGSTRLTDSDGDGVVDEERTETVESDDEGRPLVQQIDTIGDGSPRRETTTFVYDGDVVVEQTITVDLLIDGMPDSIERQTWVVADGRVVEFTWTTDMDGDGTVDYVYRVTSVYDDRGVFVSSTTEIDQDADGTVDVKTTQTRTVE